MKCDNAVLGINAKAHSILRYLCQDRGIQVLREQLVKCDAAEALAERQRVESLRQECISQFSARALDALSNLHGLQATSREHLRPRLILARMRRVLGAAQPKATWPGLARL